MDCCRIDSFSLLFYFFDSPYEVNELMEVK